MGRVNQTASAVKRRVFEYVAERHNANNAHELATAAHSDGGIRGVTTVVVKKIETSFPQDYVQPVIPNINLYSNFKFGDNRQVDLWKAYNVGNGIEFLLPENSQINAWVEFGSNAVFRSDLSYWIDMEYEQETCLPVPNLDTPISSQDQGRDDDQETTDDQLDRRACLRLFHCPEQNCKKSFNKQANLWNHITVGDHLYYQELETLSDFALKTYSSLAMDKDVKEALERIPEEFTHYKQEEVAGRIENMGHALRKPAARSRFTMKQRTYLIEKFNQGEQSGKKFDAKHVAEEMRTIKKPNSDDPMFSASEFLTWQQISSYWSTYAKKNKRMEPVDNENDNEQTVGNDVYICDPNFESTDDLVEQATNHAIDTLQETNQ